MDILEALFSTCVSPNYIPFSQLLSGKKLIIYGAGGLFESFDAFVLKRSKNINPVLIDKKFTELGSSSQIDPVSFFQNVSQDLKNSKFKTTDLIIICIGDEKISKEIYNKFSNSGFKNILHAYEIYGYNLIYASKNFSENPYLHLLKDSENIKKAYELMSDDLSKDTFYKFLKVYIEKVRPSFNSQTYATQYTPTDIPLVNKDIRVLNCGAYNGDTLLGLIKNYGRLSLACALEPDIDNFNKLQSNKLIHDNCDQLILLPLGASSENSITNFESGNGMISRLTLNSNSKTMIQTVRLDKILHGLKFNKIIIDTEGHEKEIITGLDEIIKESYPDLCIASYHQPSDIYNIPLIINERYSKYKIYLRNHSSVNVDTVLYAIN